MLAFMTGPFFPASMTSWADASAARTIRADDAMQNKRSKNFGVMAGVTMTAQVTAANSGIYDGKPLNFRRRRRIANAPPATDLATAQSASLPHRRLKSRGRGPPTIRRHRESRG